VIWYNRKFGWTLHDQGPLFIHPYPNSDLPVGMALSSAYFCLQLNFASNLKQGFPRKKLFFSIGELRVTALIKEEHGFKQHLFLSTTQLRYQPKAGFP
jgi:hypothetical protein